MNFLEHNKNEQILNLIEKLINSIKQQEKEILTSISYVEKIVEFQEILKDALIKTINDINNLTSKLFETKQKNTKNKNSILNLCDFFENNFLEDKQVEDECK